MNKIGQIELSSMPKQIPITGPMRTQPVERAANVATAVLPLMPTAGNLKKVPESKLTTRTEAVRAVLPDLAFDLLVAILSFSLTFGEARSVAPI
jgi:hypothetical protein